MSRDGSPGRFRRFAILLLFGLLVVLGVAAFRAGPPPAITIEPQLPGIGKRTAVQIQVSEPKRGLSGVRVELVQGERVDQLANLSHTPIPSWHFWGERVETDQLTVEVGSELQQNLVEGQATLRVLAERATSYLRSPDPAVQEIELTVKLRPPTLEVMSLNTFVAQGGSETVVYRVGESAVRDGVQAGDIWFPGYPLPGGDARARFALFGAPYNLDSADTIRLIAEDDVGNTAQASFVNRFTARPIKRDTIRLSENFMQRVVPAILAQTTELEDQGDLLQNYLEINRELRKKNNATLAELCRDTAEEFLWTEPFMQMRNAKVMSTFADKRTYTYQGNAVDEQDHLGFDLASTRMAPIESANTGIVVLSRYFGIYGNAVVVDHGFGLMSLYGHLSSLAVEEGQRVERGQELGRSGATGLAGGDHLHFTMMLQGLPVDPREWWDGRWIHHRLKLKLEGALPFEP